MATRPLSRARILQAAFSQADKNGIEAVTMRSVAGKLGVEAMSLYHHVPNKKAMLDGLFDLAIQVAGLPTGDVTSEEWIRGFAAGLRGLAKKHPRLVPLLSSRAVPLDDPMSALPFESGIAAFVNQGYDLPEAYAAVQAVAVSLLSMAGLEATAATESLTAEVSDLDLLPEDDFPYLVQIADLDVGLDEFWSMLVESFVRGLC